MDIQIGLGVTTLKLTFNKASGESLVKLSTFEVIGIHDKSSRNIGCRSCPIVREYILMINRDLSPKSLAQPYALHVK